MGSLRKGMLLFLVLVAALAGCETLKESKPILPMREYEKMIAGRLDANYIGTANCLAACHYHDKIKHDFDASTMGAQLSKKSNLPLVDCESCHGPGSLAVEGITAEQVALDAKAGKRTACNYTTLINLKELPAPAQSLICLKCHTGSTNFNLHNWNAGTHAQNDVSCFACHKIHMGPDLTVRREEMENLCERCHHEVKAEFSMPSHHPIHERKIFCTSCHEPHGSSNEKNLKKHSVREVCTQCHADKDGPYVYEHAENMEDCRTCHSPHGSVNNNLLKASQPFLCLQCHVSHGPLPSTTRPTRPPTTIPEQKNQFFTRCTDCHSTIHGTDLPSRGGRGRFTY
ncbi:MAG: DmsE family decaheme c-type cytochrome [Thermodesulfovibrionales bacterium]